MRPVNVLLVAEESAGIQVLRRVAESGHRLVGVMTAPQTRGGGATVAGVAEGLGLTVLPSERVRNPDLADWIRGENVDLLLNVHSLFVAHGDVVGAPAIGSFNLHPGPLPGYAGLNAPSWAIYNREPSHAVTVHWMEPGIDTGAIAYESSFDLAESDTGLSVSVRCVREGLPLIERLLEDAEAGAIPKEEQDLAGRRYFGRDAPQEGKVEWGRPAAEIVAFVRACDYFPFPSPWGHPLARLDGSELSILKAERTGEPSSEEPGSVGAVEENAAAVAAADEWVSVKRVSVEGEAEDAGAVLQTGQRLEDG
jgi:UDP-4-amino-4-deoxy-L-arabinose formyltransferase/UDP-glucuronic acid dehydrogenase (UDP-4-keto-hexauronic acid decarboxylating)